MTERELLEKAVKVLQAAPVKFRIDFDPYWQWYDKECRPTIELIATHLDQPPQASEEA